MLQTLRYMKKICIEHYLSLIITFILTVALNFSSSYLFKTYNIKNIFASISIHLFYDWVPIFLISYLVFKIRLNLEDWFKIVLFFIFNIIYCYFSPMIFFKAFSLLPALQLLEEPARLFSLYFFYYGVLLFIEKYYDFKHLKNSFLIFIFFLTVWNYCYFYFISVSSLKTIFKLFLNFVINPLGIFYLFADIEINKKSIKFYKVKTIFFFKFFLSLFLIFLFLCIFVKFDSNNIKFIFSISCFIGLFPFILGKKNLISIDTEEKTLFLYQDLFHKTITIDIFKISTIKSYDCKYWGEASRGVPTSKIGKAPIIVLNNGTEYKIAPLSNFETSIDELKKAINSIKSKKRGE